MSGRRSVDVGPGVAPPDLVALVTATLGRRDLGVVAAQLRMVLAKFDVRIRQDGAHVTVLDPWRARGGPGGDAVTTFKSQQIIDTETNPPKLQDSRIGSPVIANCGKLPFTAAQWAASNVFLLARLRSSALMVNFFIFEADLGAVGMNIVEYGLYDLDGDPVDADCFGSRDLNNPSGFGAWPLDNVMCAPGDVPYPRRVWEFITPALPSDPFGHFNVGARVVTANAPAADDFFRWAILYVQ